MQPGFTLIELMLVIGLIAILMAVASPAIMASVRQSGVRHAADQLAMDMQRAKLLAIKQNASCAITFDLAANQYTISLNNQVVNLATYHGGVHFTAADSDASITFTPQGLSSSPGAVVLTNQNKDRTYRVRTTSAGGISTKLWTGTKWM
jgi:prepilin-type N-terminal cleavage/methylation domain-containing protein